MQCDIKFRNVMIVKHSPVETQALHRQQRHRSSAQTYFKFTLTTLMYRDRSKEVAKRKRSESIQAPVTQTHRKEEEEAS